MLQSEGNLGEFEGRVVEGKAGRRGEVRGEVVPVDDGHATTPGGAGERPDGTTTRGQISTLGLVTMGSEPRLVQKENVYVVVGNDGRDFCTFLEFLHRSCIEQRYFQSTGLRQRTRLEGNTHQVVVVNRGRAGASIGERKFFSVRY